MDEINKTTIAFVYNDNVYVTNERNIVPNGAIAITVPEGTQLDEVEWDGTQLRLKDKATVEQERLQRLRDQALELNLKRYRDFCETNDGEIEKYRKRSELGILDENDEADYQYALESYRTATIEYRATKEAIMNMSQQELEKLDGLFWGDPIELSDATGYPVTEVSYNTGPYAIVETGSNSNGSWIKFSDGTMIIHGKQTGSIPATGYPSSVLDVSGSFPTSFIDNPSISFSAAENILLVGGARYSDGSGSASPTSWKFAVANNYSSTLPYIVTFMAIGRWK